MTHIFDDGSESGYERAERLEKELASLRQQLQVAMEALEKISSIKDIRFSGITIAREALTTFRQKFPKKKP